MAPFVRLGRLASLANYRKIVPVVRLGWLAPARHTARARTHYYSARAVTVNRVYEAHGHSEMYTSLETRPPPSVPYAIARADN